MKFGIIQEAESAPEQRYHEMLVEAVFAESMGFDSYGVSERHFLDNRGVSSPEVMLSAVVARTERIRVRFLSVVLLAYNHPVRVAEQITTLDVLSKGRIEAVTARSQQPLTIEGFGIDPTQTRAQWAESLEVIVKAMTQDEFEHDGPIFKVPRRTLTPKPVQRPHPPLYASATSMDTHRIAGEKALGLISGNSLVGGWQFVDNALGTYRDALAASTVVPLVPPKVGVASLVAHCAPTADQAKAEATPRVHGFLRSTIARRRQLAPTAPDYEYQQAGFAEIEERKDDLDHLIDRSPYFTIGTPDFFIERFRRLEAMGVDEVVLEIEGLDHKLHMQTIELLGRHVIPAFAS